MKPSVIAAVVPLLYVTLSVSPVVSRASFTSYSVFEGAVAISTETTSIALIATLKVTVLPSYVTVIVFVPAVVESKPVTA